MNIGEMQKKLSEWATQDKEHKFFDLYHLLFDMMWLQQAHDNVAKNAGSITAGCDGINMRDFDKNLEENLQVITKELREGTFEPNPVRRVYIPKSDGKRRPLGIPSIRDRIVQEALRMVLEPVYEADFCPNSYGFRPNKSTWDAISHICLVSNNRTKYFWVIEGDIASYFDTIKHRKLIKLLKKRIKDKKLLDLIWKFLRAGVMERKLFKNTVQGTPQGGIISPLLANIYLHELDKYMERKMGTTESRRTRRKKGLSNFVHVRYADDFIVLCNGTKEQAEEKREELKTFLKTELGLELSMEKTKVTHMNDGFEFLGVEIKRCRSRTGKLVLKKFIPESAVRNVLDKVRHITSKTTHNESANAKINALNSVIRGWCNYYRHCSIVYTKFHKVEYQTSWHLTHWLGRKYQIPTPKVMQRYKGKSTLQTDTQTLLRATSIKWKKYYSSPQQNPYLTGSEITREESLQDDYWAGQETRPGIGDLRPQVLRRDQYTCQTCGTKVTRRMAEIDHKKRVARFKDKAAANRMDNLQTLCIPCHKAKTKKERQVESRVR